MADACRRVGSAASGGRGWLFAVGVLLLLAAGCTKDNTDLVLVGSVERTLVEVSAASSEAIVKVSVERGAHVDAGTPLVQLDAAIAEADLARAEAGVAAAQTEVVVTARDLERARDLYRRKIAPEDQLEHAQLAWDQAGAKRREADALLKVAHKRLSDMSIVAPVAGVVDQIPFDLGERVPAGAVVAVLLQDGLPWVRVWLPERAVSQVGPGTRAEVSIDGIQQRLTGRVLDVAREPEFTPHYALTERERVYLVYETRVLIEDAPASLRPGSPASVIIRLGAVPG